MKQGKANYLQAYQPSHEPHGFNELSMIVDESHGTSTGPSISKPKSLRLINTLILMRVS